MTTDSRLEHVAGDAVPTDAISGDAGHGDAGLGGAGLGAREAPSSGPGAGPAGTRGGRWRSWRRHPVVGWVGTALAGALVFFALVAPNETSRFAAGAFVRIPLEALVAAAVLLVLPAKPRRVVAVVLGVLLGLLTLVKVIDMGFFAVLVRPFNPVLDWSLLSIAVETLGLTLGRTGAIVAVVAVVLLAVGLLVLVPLAILRLTRLAVRHNTGAVRTLAVLGLAWVVCAVSGVELAPGLPVASKGTAELAHDRVVQIRAGMRDKEAFAAEAKVDAFKHTPGDKLLNALRGKDVIVAFVESYGRDAVEDPEFAPQVGAVLDEGTRRLSAAGYTSRSAFLTSPTAGGASWLAHATLLSGLWIDNQERYRNLLASDRLTLGTAFKRADWRTVGVMPAVNRAWPEGAFYGYDQVYDSRNLGYRGPTFSYAPMPDQFVLSAFQRAEAAAAGRAPLMAEIGLISSHTPWAPIPKLIDWKDVGDGSVYGPIAAAGEDADDVWRDRSRVRTEYRRSIEYTLGTLVSYVETYGDDDLVLVFLGDHQPAPIVTGDDASRDVPITIVSRDRAVMDRVSGWGWQEGLKPGPQAPVTRMDTFRDRFLSTFGTA